MLGIDNALNSIQCILIFNRDKQFRYALANPSLVTSGAKSFMSTGDAVFVMSVYDPGEESMYASRNIINVGFIEPFESEVAATFFNMLGQKHETFTVANIGANLGWYSILAARTSAGVKVDAFEPAPQSLRLLRNTIAINDLAHIIAVHDVALSDEKGSVDFYVYESNAGGNRRSLMVPVSFLKMASDRSCSLSSHRLCSTCVVSAATITSWSRNTTTRYLP